MRLPLNARNASNATLTKRSDASTQPRQLPQQHPQVAPLLHTQHRLMVTSQIQLKRSRDLSEEIWGKNSTQWGAFIKPLAPTSQPQSYSSGDFHSHPRLTQHSDVCKLQKVRWFNSEQNHRHDLRADTR